MTPSDRIISVVTSFQTKGEGESHYSNMLGDTQRDTAPFELDTDTLVGCLWEILRDEKVPEKGNLRQLVVNILHNSKVTSKDAMDLSFRAGGPEWDHHWTESGLLNPKENIKETEAGIKELLMGRPGVSYEENGGRLLVPMEAPNKPRNYQSEVINKSLKQLDQEKKSWIVLPTGTGKTRCALEIAASLFQSEKIDKVIWSTNRTDLLEQTHESLAELWTKYHFIPGNERLPPLRPITNKETIFTDDPKPKFIFRTHQAKPHEKTPTNSRTMLIVDENHRHIPQYSPFVETVLTSGGLVLGLTATPGDKYSEISNIFGKLILPDNVKMGQNLTIEKASFEEAGIISIQHDHQVDIPISEMQPHKRLEGMVEIVEEKIRLLDLKKSIVYVKLVRDAKLLAGRLSGRGIPSTHVSGDTSHGARISIKRDLEEGKISVVTNPDLWKEGVDIPSVDSVFIFKETHLETLREQIIGRALRGPAVPGGTPDAHVIWGW